MNVDGMLMDMVGMLKNVDGMLTRPDTQFSFLFAYIYAMLTEYQWNVDEC